MTNLYIILTIQRFIEDSYGLQRWELDKNTKARAISEPRQMAMYFASKLTNKCSLNAIGFILGKKDHVTVMHAIKTVKNLMESDQYFKNDILELQFLIKDRLHDINHVFG